MGRGWRGPKVAFLPLPNVASLLPAASESTETETPRGQEALYVVGGLNGSTSIPEVEVATLGLQLDWHVLPQLLPTQRNRLGAVFFKKQPAPAG